MGMRSTVDIPELAPVALIKDEDDVPDGEDNVVHNVLEMVPVLLGVPDGRDQDGVCGGNGQVNDPVQPVQDVGIHTEGDEDEMVIYDKNYEYAKD